MISTTGRGGGGGQIRAERGGGGGNYRVPTAGGGGGGIAPQYIWDSYLLGNPRTRQIVCDILSF